jgi:MFS family permease
MTASNGVALLCIGRVVCGVSVGIASSIVPVYQAEIAPKEIRGRVVSLQQWAITWYVIHICSCYSSAFFNPELGAS